MATGAVGAVLASIALLANNDEATNAMAKSFMTSYQEVMGQVCAMSDRFDEAEAEMPVLFAAMSMLAADLRIVIKALEALEATPGSNLFIAEANSVKFRILVHTDCTNGGTQIGVLFPNEGISLATPELGQFVETYIHFGGQVEEFCSQTRESP
jgi:hypothetical protein